MVDNPRSEREEFIARMPNIKRALTLEESIRLQEVLKVFVMGGIKGENVYELVSRSALELKKRKVTPLDFPQIGAATHVAQSSVCWKDWEDLVEAYDEVFVNRKEQPKLNGFDMSIPVTPSGRYKTPDDFDWKNMLDSLRPRASKDPF